MARVMSALTSTQRHFRNVLLVCWFASQGLETNFHNLSIIYEISTSGKRATTWSDCPFQLSFINITFHQWVDKASSYNIHRQFRKLPFLLMAYYNDVSRMDCVSCVHPSASQTEKKEPFDEVDLAEPAPALIQRHRCWSCRIAWLCTRD